VGPIFFGFNFKKQKQKTHKGDVFFGILTTNPKQKMININNFSLKKFGFKEANGNQRSKFF